MVTDIISHATLTEVILLLIRPSSVGAFSSGSPTDCISEEFGNVDAVVVLEGHNRGMNWAI